MTSHKLADGKYTVHHENGILTADRYGESWDVGTRALSGDGLSLAMIQRIEEVEEKNEELKLEVEHYRDLYEDMLGNSWK